MDWPPRQRGPGHQIQSLMYWQSLKGVRMDAGRLLRDIAGLKQDVIIFAIVLLFFDVIPC